MRLEGHHYSNLVKEMPATMFANEVKITLDGSDDNHFVFWENECVNNN